MFFELSKLLRFFVVSPVSWMLILLVAFYFVKCKKVKYALLGLAVAVFVVFTNNPLVDYVQYRMTRQYAACASVPAGKHYRVAIVMGGFGHMNEETGQLVYEEDRADRLWEAVRLYKAGIVDRVLITGDPTSLLRGDGSTTAGLFLAYMEQMGVPREAFILEQRATNTRQNAVNTCEILSQMGISDRDCLLITSATHMERSEKCFAKVGLRPDVMAVNIPECPSRLNHRAFYPDWGAALEWEIVMNEWIGDIAYRIMGYV